MDVQLHVGERIRITGELPKPVCEAIVEKFTYPNPAWGKAKMFGFKGRVPKFLVSWDGFLPGQPNAWIESTGIRIPVVGSVSPGCIRRLIEILQVAGIRYSLIEDRVFASVEMPEHQVDLYDYQDRLVIEAVDACEQFGMSLWRSPQASGKTTAGLAFLARIRQKALVIVANSVLFRQWQDRVRTEMGFAPGVIGGGKSNVEPPIVIGMQQSLRNIDPGIFQLFGCVLCDEIQLFAATTFQGVLDNIPAAYRLGISGDERRADHKECLIYDQFGPVTSEVKAAELQKAGKIHDVEIRVVPTEFRCDWWTGIDRMAPHRGESDEDLRKRKVQLKIQMAEKLAEEMARDVDRNTIVTDLVHESVKDTGNCLVLCTRREHCHAIDKCVTEQGYRSGLLIGGADYRDQFDLTLRQFRAGEIRVAVGTYQAIGVGFDLPTISRGVFAFPVANSKSGRMQWQQYRGRFARTAVGKSDAALYYPLDFALYGIKPLRHLMAWNNRVVVWSSGQWVPAATYLKGNFDHAQTQRRTNATDQHRDRKNRTSTTREQATRQDLEGGGFAESINGRNRSIGRNPIQTPGSQARGLDQRSAGFNRGNVEQRHAGRRRIRIEAGRDSK